MKPGPLTSVFHAVIGVFLVSGCAQLQNTYDTSRVALTEILTPAENTGTPEIQALIDEQRQREALRRERRQTEAVRARRDQLEKTAPLSLWTCSTKCIGAVRKTKTPSPAPPSNPIGANSVRNCEPSFDNG